MIESSTARRTVPAEPLPPYLASKSRRVEQFHGEIIAELERLRASDTVRVIDSLAVYKDANGELEVEHLSNLSEDEAIELGSKVGALVGLGIEGEEGAFDSCSEQRSEKTESAGPPSADE